MSWGETIFLKKCIDGSKGLVASDNFYASIAGLLIGSKNIQTFLAKYDINVEPIPSLFLGSCEMNLLNMMSIYNTFASNGYFYKPSFKTELSVIVAARESRKSINLLRLGITVLDKEHGNEGEHHKNSAEGEEHRAHTEDIVKEARKNGGNYLRRH